MRTLSYTAKKSDEGRSVLSVLKGELKASSSLVKLNKQRGGNLLNGVPVFVNCKIHAGDVVSLVIDDEYTPKSPDSVDYNVDIPVVFEDDYLIVIDKPAGIEVHPSPLAGGAALSELMQGRFGAGEGFHAVNRLDRGTSGLMVIAKTGYMHALLMPLLHTDAFIRRYLAVCEGVPSPEKGEITLPIARDPHSPIKRIISSTGAPSRTSYEVIERSCGRSLVLLTAHTGRTHQLRLHMSAIGCPLTGDWLYGKEDRSVIRRPALHSSSILLTHPLTGERIALQAPLPCDIASLLRSLPPPRC